MNKKSKEILNLQKVFIFFSVYIHICFFFNCTILSGKCKIWGNTTLVLIFRVTSISSPRKERVERAAR